MPRVISVIENIRKVGGNTETNPLRIITEYFTLDGELLAGRDDWLNDKLNGASDKKELGGDNKQ